MAGRPAAVAVDGLRVSAGGADGGLWRSRDAGSTWQAMTDGLDSTSSGAIGVNPKDHSVWYATGESSTAFDNYVGTGVYVSDDHAATWSKVGGDELDGQMTSGSSSMVTVTSSWGRPWDRASLVERTAGCSMDRGGTARHARAVRLHVRERRPGRSHRRHAHGGEHRLARRSDRLQRLLRVHERWRVVVDGRPRRHQRPPIGKSSFAFGSDGRLYSLVESIHKYLFNPETVLMGVYNPAPAMLPVRGRASRPRSSSGTRRAPRWASGPDTPGDQAWYNQALGVAPNNPNRVFVGMEEVYETRNQGDAWTTIGPYWNFGLPCGATTWTTAEDHAPRPARHRVRPGQAVDGQRRRHLQP